MTENKRFMYYEHKGADYILENPNLELDFIEMLGDALSSEEIVDRLNEQEEYINKLEKEKINLQIKLQKIRDFAEEDGEVKQGVIEKVVMSNDRKTNR